MNKHLIIEKRLKGNKTKIVFDMLSTKLTDNTDIFQQFKSQDISYWIVSYKVNSYTLSVLQEIMKCITPTTSMKSLEK